MDPRQRHVAIDVLETFTLLSEHKDPKSFRRQNLNLADYLIEKGYCKIDKAGFVKLSKKGRIVYDGLLEKLNEYFQGFPRMDPPERRGV